MNDTLTVNRLMAAGLIMNQKFNDKALDILKTEVANPNIRIRILALNIIENLDDKGKVFVKILKNHYNVNQPVMFHPDRGLAQYLIRNYNKPINAR